MIAEAAGVPVEEEERPISGFGIGMTRVGGDALAHLDAERLGERLSGDSERRVVRDQQQRAAAAHPLGDRPALLLGEGGRP